MSTQEKISAIILKRYDNYKGRAFNHLEELHQEIREKAGDEKFLKFLQAIEDSNPRPVYSIPEDFRKLN